MKEKNKREKEERVKKWENLTEEKIKKAKNDLKVLINLKLSWNQNLNDNRNVMC
jgi:hypothetical protein